MDPHGSISVVPPAGSQPSRSKSLRQQRAFNGATIIKAYVQQSEQRREQSKFHAAASRAAQSLTSPCSQGDIRWEDTQRSSLSPRGSVAEDLSVLSARAATPRGNQQLHDAHALDALFSERRVRRSRRPSVVSTMYHLALGTAPSVLDHSKGDPISMTHAAATNPVLRRRLQMESVSTSLGSPPRPTQISHGHRPVSSAVVARHPRTRHNLGAKLDALAKSSMLNRRKVVLNGDDKAVKIAIRNVSPRHVKSSSGGYGADGHVHGGRGRDPSVSEIESRVMAAFRQIVRLWRERKRRAEAAALTKMNGRAGGIATGTGRNGSKLRKDLTAQQSSVVGIISRRLIREIPALKFFDEETGAAPSATGVKGADGSIALTDATDQRPGATNIPAAVPITERTKPRGVCYTVDAAGCRKIKIQSSTTIVTPSRHRSNKTVSTRQHKMTNEELTLEKALNRSLHRKMARRVKSRRQSILRLGDDFSKSRNDLAMKLRSQLALQHAQIEKMFGTRLQLLMSDDTKLPSYQAQKELHLARVRCRKANLLQKCKTLRVLGRVLKHVEAAGDSTGLEVTTGELHFLDLFRCVVEEDQVLTPIISDAIRQHMRPQDLKQPLVTELFLLLDQVPDGSDYTKL